MTVVWQSAPLPGSGKDKKGMGRDASRGEAPVPCPTPTPQEIGFGSTVVMVGVSVFQGFLAFYLCLGSWLGLSVGKAWLVAGGVSDISLRPGQDQTSKAQAGAWVDGAWQASSRCVQLFLPVPIRRLGLRDLGQPFCGSQIPRFGTKGVGILWSPSIVTALRSWRPSSPLSLSFDQGFF